MKVSILSFYMRGSAR